MFVQNNFSGPNNEIWDIQVRIYNFCATYYSILQKFPQHWQFELQSDNSEETLTLIFQFGSHEYQLSQRVIQSATDPVLQYLLSKQPNLSIYPRNSCRRRHVPSLYLITNSHLFRHTRSINSCRVSSPWAWLNFAPLSQSVGRVVYMCESAVWGFYQPGVKVTAGCVAQPLRDSSPPAVIIKLKTLALTQSEFINLVNPSRLPACLQQPRVLHSPRCISDRGGTSQYPISVRNNPLLQRCNSSFPAEVIDRS